jgi:hypothetical protein
VRVISTEDLLFDPLNFIQQYRARLKEGHGVSVLETSLYSLSHITLGLLDLIEEQNRVLEENGFVGVELANPVMPLYEVQPTPETQQALDRLETIFWRDQVKALKVQTRELEGGDVEAPTGPPKRMNLM